ncbi:unnamed protein product [Alopecurus aequalis]
MPSPPLRKPSPKLVCLPLLLALAVTVAVTLLCVAGLNATQARSKDPRPALHPAMSATVRDGQTTLALRLAKHLAPAGVNATKGNVAFSPVSIHAALALLAAGARGATLDQLLAFLGAPSAAGLADFGRRIAHRVLGDRAASGGPRVLFSGGIWVDASRDGLKTAFRDVAVESYKSEARTVSFADEPEEVAEAINSWAKKATNNLIDSIISAKDITAETDLVLANAVYFKAKWKDPFKSYHTGPGTFHRLDGSRVDAQFMSQTIYGAHYASCVDGFKVLKLAYKHDPDDVPRFRHKNGRGAAAGADDTHYSMLPKFQISYDWDLGRDLRLLGLSSPFSPESADLRGIFQNGRPTFLSKVLHKAVVKVDEDGTEAAAVTSVMLDGSAWQPEPPIEFVADHPFTFFIMEERSGVIVFAGHVLDPTN